MFLHRAATRNAARTMQGKGRRLLCCQRDGGIAATGRGATDQQPARRAADRHSAAIDHHARKGGGGRYRQRHAVRVLRSLQLQDHIGAVPGDDGSRQWKARRARIGDIAMPGRVIGNSLWRLERRKPPRGPPWARVAPDRPPRPHAHLPGHSGNSIAGDERRHKPAQPPPLSLVKPTQHKQSLGPMRAQQWQQGRQPHRGGQREKWRHGDPHQRLCRRRELNPRRD